MKHVSRAVFMIVAIAAVPALAVVPTTLVSWNTMNSPAPSNSTQHFGWVIDGTTSYHQLATGAGSRIVKVANFDPDPGTATELLSNGAWAAAAGTSSLTSFYGFGQSGGFLQFTDTSSDAVWRVDKGTGAISAYVTKAQIQAFTGGSNVQLLSATKIMPSGEQAFYEGQVDAILATAGAGAVTTLVSNAQLMALQGNADVSGGIGFDLSGDMYWGNNTNDAIYKLASGGALSVALSTADISALTGAATAGFGDIEGGPDGWMYFRESTSKAILKFDPNAPASSLSYVLTEAELLSGPAASSNVFEIGFYGSQFAFGISSANGLYVPEPATMVLLVAGGLLALRRRR